MPASVSTITKQGKPAWQGYVRFGSAVNFDIVQFLGRETVPRVQRAVNRAKADAKGPEVTPEDFVLAIINQFEDTLEEYRASDDKLSFEGVGYLATAMGLNQTNTFEENKAMELKQLAAMKARLLKAREGNTVEPEKRTGQLSTRLLGIFGEARKTFQNLQDQKGDELKQRLITDDMLLQVFARMEKGLAGDIVREFYENLRLKPVFRVDQFLSEDASKSQVVSGNTTEPVNLSQKSAEGSLPDYPAVPEDINQIVECLLSPAGKNNVVMVLPEAVQEDGIINEVAKGLNQAQLGKQEEQRHTLVKLDFRNFLVAASKGVETKNLLTPGFVIQEALTKLHEGIKDAALKFPRPIIFLKNFGELMEEPKNDKSINAYLEEILKDKRVSLIVGVSNELPPSSEPHGITRPLAMAKWLSLFQPVNIDKPGNSEIASHVANLLDPLKSAYPKVEFTQGAVEKATHMALMYGGKIPTIVLDFLGRAAKAFPEGPLTGDRVKHAVERDPYLNYTQTVAAQSDFLKINPANIQFPLCEMVGLNDLKRYFATLREGIEQNDRYKALGLQIPTRAIVAGETGTGKTDAVLGFAKEMDLPVAYLDGRKMTGNSILQVSEKLNQAVMSAEKESQRRERLGKKPYVMVVVDHLERALTPTGDGKVINALAELLAQKMERLRLENDQRLIVIGITNSNTGVTPNLLDPKRIHQIVLTEPTVEKDRVALMQRFVGLQEAEVGHAIYSPDVQYDKAAKRLTGATGNELLQILEMARKEALKENSFPDGLVHNIHLDRAITALHMGGPENKDLYKRMKPDQLRMVAYHEGGHATSSVIMDQMLKTNRKLEKVTVVPQGNALGVAFYTDQDETHLRMKTDLFANLVTSVASREMEKRLGMSSSGYIGDNQSARRIATAMVGQFAMGKGQQVFINTPYEQAPKGFQQEVERFIGVAQTIGGIIMTHYKPFVDQLVDRLAGPTGEGGEETLSGPDFVAFLEAFQAQHPRIKTRVERQIHRQLAKVFPERYTWLGRPKF